MKRSISLFCFVLTTLLVNNKVFADAMINPIKNGEAITFDECPHLAEDVYLNLSNNVKGSYMCNMAETTRS